MIVGIETSALSTRITGTSRYITCLIEQLKTFDNEVKSFSAFNSSRKFLIKKKGVQKYLYRNFHLRKEMEDSKIDYAFFPDYFMPKDFTKPSAIVIHDLSFISHPQFYSKSFVAFYKYQLKETLKNNPVIVTISELSKKTIVEYLNIKPENIHLLQAYSSFNDKTNYYPGKGNYLLYVGHIEPRKNLHFLISNFLKWTKLRKVDLRLVITGEFWRKTKETKKTLNEFVNCPNIEFTGYVDEPALTRLYSNASGFVHTSYVEGFCVPVLEAMHYNLPLICSSGTAAEEISSPYSIRINPRNDKSLIAGFDELYQVILTKEKINYKIKYSPALMREQLVLVTDILKSKIKKTFFISVPQVKDKEEAIEKTLLYSNLFNSGIKRYQLYKSIFDVRINSEELESLLLKLYFENKIYFKDDSVFLNYKSSVYKKPLPKPNQPRNKKAFKILKFVPFISSISFSGGTAHYGLEDHEDIDLFIITRPNALYIVYAFIHLLSLLFRIRKELCANYLIDERGMKIKYPHDFYTAHQIISLKPYKNEKMLNHFFNKNSWIQKYFPNFSWNKSEKNTHLVKNLFLIPFNKTLKFLYKLIYKKQLKENLNKTSIILDELSIKLHTNDNHQRITEEFYKAWKNYKTRAFVYSNPDQLKEKAVV